MKRVFEKDDNGQAAMAFGPLGLWAFHRPNGPYLSTFFKPLLSNPNYILNFFFFFF